MTEKVATPNSGIINMKNSNILNTILGDMKVISKGSKKLHFLMKSCAEQKDKSL